MKSNLLILLFFCLSFAGFAQNDTRIADTKTPLSAVEQVVLPLQNNKQLLEIELAERRVGRANKFAEAIEVNITPRSHGNWENLANGNAVWRLRLQSLGAKSLNLGFTEYELPTNSSLILYTPDYEKVRGPFTPADNEEHMQLWTPILEGSDMVIELQVPQVLKNDVKLKLSYINHDFVGFASMSQSCNLDVACGTQDGWEIVEDYRDIIQSVSMYVRGGTRICTGFLINNARQDCAPFFMTANHCGMNEGNAASIVTYWNFENSTCREVGSSASGGNGDGQLNIFNSGSKHLASSPATDFTLLLLDDPVVEEANAFFAGWDTKPEPPAKAVCIHHPNTDEKRISFENDPTYIATQGGDPSATGSYVGIEDWDIGTTEPGSSGSPLFDFTTKRVVGQLFGGLAACGNDEYDVYGRFHLSYTGNGSPEASLQPWLDPDNTGITEIDGRTAISCNFFVEAQPNTIEICQEGEAVYTLVVSDNFTDSVNIVVRGEIPPNAMIEVSPNKVAGGDTLTLSVLNISEIPQGEYTMTVRGSDGIDSTETELNFALFEAAPAPVATLSPANQAENVSTVVTFEWEAFERSVSYDIQISTDSTFAVIDADSTSNLSTSSFTSLMLEQETKYFWRVRATNICGVGDWSASTSFTTAIIICGNTASTNVPVEISNGAPAAYTSTLDILTGGEIVDLNVVNLRGEHTWIADLGFTLTSPMGTTITLIEPTCFDQDDFNLSLDDDVAPTDLPCPYNNGNTYRPNGALAAFNGENPIGTWTLTVTDGASQDGGRLQNWGLEICAARLGDFTVLTDNNNIDACLGDTVQINLTVGTDFSAESFNLSVENLPEGAIIDYGTNRVQPGDSLNIMITNFQSGTNGTYNLLFSAEDDEQLGLVQVVLNLNEMPTATMPISPMDGTEEVEESVTFRFTEVSQTDNYFIEIATDENFENIVTTMTVSSPVFNTNLNPATTYFWRVTTQNSCGTSISSTASFSTALDLSITASPNAITACSSAEVLVSLTLGESFAEGGATISVEGQLGDATFNYSQNPVPAGATVEVTIDNLNNLEAGAYNLIFTADDGINSNTIPFALTLLKAPIIANLESPEEGAQFVDANTTFVWETVNNADNYIIEVSTSSDFAAANLVFSETVSTNTYTVNAPLAMGDYFWRINTENECGGSTSSVATFRVATSAVTNIAGNEFEIYPNPSTGIFKVEFAQALKNVLDFKVMAINGQVLHTTNLPVGQLQQAINLQGLPQGVYILQIQSELGMATRKLIVK